MGKPACTLTALRPHAFTGSGEDVDTQLLQEFADITQTSLATGNVNDIKQIYNNMSNYF